MKRPSTRSDQRGTSLVELLVSMVLVALVVGAGMREFPIRTRAIDQEYLLVSMEQNLRQAAGMVSDPLRGAGDGVPKSNLATWIPWISGFSANPKITTVTGSPATISIARCSTQPVATLSATATTGAISISVTSNISGATLSSLFDTSTQRLVLIGRDNAHVTAVGSGTLTIDTNPTVALAQGLTHSYGPGTPVCRVDVVTFAIATDSTTGRPQLRMNENQGGGWSSVAEGITDLQITTVDPGKRFQIFLTAETERSISSTGATLFRTLRTDVTVRNALL